MLAPKTKTEKNISERRQNILNKKITIHIPVLNKPINLKSTIKNKCTLKFCFKNFNNFSGQMYILFTLPSNINAHIYTPSSMK